jgi:hypothetical protein
MPIKIKAKDSLFIAERMKDKNLDVSSLCYDNHITLVSSEHFEGFSLVVSFKVLPGDYYEFDDLGKITLQTLFDIDSSKVYNVSVIHFNIERDKEGYLTKEHIIDF